VFHRVTPRAAFIFMPSSTQSLKYLYGNAFRAPNAYERNVADFGPQVENLQPETISTNELVWERYINDRLRTAVSAYVYDANNLITLVPDASATLDITYVNVGEVRAKGLELETQMRLKGRADALVSYALQSAVDQATHDELVNSPRHMVKGRISIPGPTRLSFISVEAQYLSRRETLAGAKVSAAAPVNITLIQPFGRSWEISGGVQNLFNDQYADPVANSLAQDSVLQNGRTARIGLRWKPLTQK
jgi:iron complex outermembrane receptor protein